MHIVIACPNSLAAMPTTYTVPEWLSNETKPQYRNLADIAPTARMKGKKKQHCDDL